MRIRGVLFDAMETIVDVDPLPTEGDRATWTFERSACARDAWETVELFRDALHRARAHFGPRVRDGREYSVWELMREACTLGTEAMPAESLEALVASLVASYEEGYYSHCFVEAETKEALVRIRRVVPLGIVSNQIVQGGLEGFLRDQGMVELFSPIVTSVDCGWRKPAPQIYSVARDSIGLRFGEIAFVGDDPLLDYVTPRALGMYSVLVDRGGHAPDAGALHVASVREAVDHLLLLT